MWKICNNDYVWGGENEVVGFILFLLICVLYLLLHIDYIILKSKTKTNIKLDSHSLTKCLLRDCHLTW